jgi:NADH dehydrogenase FAD-containing subunit
LNENLIQISSGGGPTGVEFSAELYDLLHTDIAKHYPALAKLAKITIYDVASNILGTFDQTLRKYTCALLFSETLAHVSFGVKIHRENSIS